jgi:ATP-dependent protease ClpP protease subunit
MMLNTDELTTDMGTVLDGEMAVGCGLIDKIGSLSDALSELYGMIDESEREE